MANVDGDDKKNSALGQKYGVSGFPTIKFFPKDSTEPIDYEGGRTEADFVAFLNEKCGTQRAVGGGLSDEVSNQIWLGPPRTSIAPPRAFSKSDILIKYLI